MCAKPKIKTPAPPPPPPQLDPAAPPKQAEYVAPRLKKKTPAYLLRQNASLFGEGVRSPLISSKTLLGM